MNGVTVLNTMGGGVSPVLVFLMVMWFLALCFFFGCGISALKDEEIFLAIISGLICVTLIVGLLVVWTDRFEPIRYEVTVNPGHVIDAVRWEIVEQRGEIYVIQAREESK
ncbi:hypothetical protein ACFOQM_23475 [Paenibacillus sp. GCM10012307]|uniref:Uncharacterized protein n=1 Tax=Paenibacillus roseus TaxID=2798579 RepID=A0A934J774_9BACL|nr:hypothetical protein [Paenibacillus roseus]MBJ6364185.1 hypothetical protein [Paenibacillus roseus]